MMMLCACDILAASPSVGAMRRRRELVSCRTKRIGADTPQTIHKMPGKMLAMFAYEVPRHLKGCEAQKAAEGRIRWYRGWHCCARMSCLTWSLSLEIRAHQLLNGGTCKLVLSLFAPVWARCQRLEAGRRQGAGQ